MSFGCGEAVQALADTARYVSGRNASQSSTSFFRHVTSVCAQVLIGYALRVSVNLCRGTVKPPPGRAAALRFVFTEAVVHTLPFLLILTFLVVTSVSSRIFKARPASSQI